MAAQAIDYLKYYSSLLENKEFQNMTTTRDRIEFILKSVRPLNLFRSDIHNKANMFLVKHCKNEERSLLFRQQGIKYHQNGDYKNAVFMFTKAILSAPIPFEDELSSGSMSHLCLAFAHTSLAEFHLKNYSSALFCANQSLELFETIEMLVHRVHCLRLLHRYNESLECLDDLILRSQNDGLDLKQQFFEELTDIKRYIIRQMNNSNNCENTAEAAICLSGTFENDLEKYGSKFWLHPGCQLQQTEGKGRHFVAKQFIPKDTVLLLEYPTTLVLSQTKTKMCSNCFKVIGSSLWPCVGCDEVVFCDKQCFITAYDVYHQYECGISGLISGLGQCYSHTYQIISRVGVKKTFEFEEQNKYIDFESYLETKRQKLEKTSDNDSEKDSDSQTQTQFEAFYSLTKNNGFKDIYTFVYQVFGSIQTALLLDYSQQLGFHIEQDFDKFVTLVEICLKNVRRVITNVHGWWEIVANNYMTPSSKLHVGSGMCIMGSLFNHSCKPNIYWKFNGPVMVFKGNRDINAGEEMCITYGPTARTASFHDRQKKLKTNYYFDCNCEACLEECKNFACVRCQHCSGPVVFVELGRFINRDNNCLKCGQKFINLRQTTIKINAIKKRLDQMITLSANNHNIEWSLKVAKNMFNLLMQLVYNKSRPLREYFKKLVKAYVENNCFAEAIHLIETFGSAVDMLYDNQDIDSLSAEALEDLFLLTKCYYNYLSDGLFSQVTDSKHWNNCFVLYSKLIDKLKEGKKAYKESAATNKDQKSEAVAQQIRYLLKDKKKELTHLIDCYQVIDFTLGDPNQVVLI